MLIAQTPDQTARTAAKPLETAAPQAKVLVVDDSQGALELRGILEARGFAVEAADGADAALRHTEASKPDAVVMEFALRGMPAAELCQRLRNRHPELPILVLTALSAPGITMQAYSAGADVVFHKPVAADALLKHLRPLQAARQFSLRQATPHLSLREFFQKALQAGPGRHYATIRSSNDTATLVIEKQQIVYAACRGLNGKPALEEILRWPLPSCAFESTLHVAQNNLAVPLADAITLWVSLLASWQLAMLVLPPKDTLLQSRPGLNALPAPLSQFALQLRQGTPLFQMLAGAGHARVRKIAALWLLGDLVTVPEQAPIAPTNDAEIMQLSALVDRYRATNAHLSRSSNKVLGLQAQAKASQAELQKREREIESWRKTTTGLKARIEELEHDAEQKASLLRQQGDAKLELTLLRNELAAAKKSTAELRSELQALNDRHAAASAALAAEQAQLAVMKTTLQAREDALDRNELELRRFRNDSERLRILAAESEGAKAVLENDLQETRAELTESKHEVEQLRREAIAAQQRDSQRLVKLSQENAALAAKLERANATSGQLEGRVNEIKAKLGEAQHFKAKLPAGLGGAVAGIALGVLTSFAWIGMAPKPAQVVAASAAATPPAQPPANLPVAAEKPAPTKAHETLAAVQEDRPTPEPQAALEAPQPVAPAAPGGAAKTPPAEPPVKPRVVASAESKTAKPARTPPEEKAVPKAGPDLAQAKQLLERGKAAYEKGNFAEAIRLLGDSIGVAPQAPAYIELGKAHYDLGAPDKAESAYRKALALSKTSSEAHLGLGMIFAERGENGAAKQELRAFLKLAPNHPLAGQVEAMLGQLP